MGRRDCSHHQALRSWRPARSSNLGAWDADLGHGQGIGPAGLDFMGRAPARPFCGVGSKARSLFVLAVHDIPGVHWFLRPERTQWREFAANGPSKPPESHYGCLQRRVSKLAVAGRSLRAPVVEGPILYVSRSDRRFLL